MGKNKKTPKEHFENWISGLKYKKNLYKKCIPYIEKGILPENIIQEIIDKKDYLSFESYEMILKLSIFNTKIFDQLWDCDFFNENSHILYQKETLPIREMYTKDGFLFKQYNSFGNIICFLNMKTIKHFENKYNFTIDYNHILKRVLLTSPQSYMYSDEESNNFFNGFLNPETLKEIIFKLSKEQKKELTMGILSEQFEPYTNTKISTSNNMLSNLGYINKSHFIQTVFEYCELNIKKDFPFRGKFPLDVYTENKRMRTVEDFKIVSFLLELHYKSNDRKLKTTANYALKKIQKRIKELRREDDRKEAHKALNKLLFNMACRG